MYDPVMQSSRDAQQEENFRNLACPDGGYYGGYRRGSLTGLPVVTGRPVNPAVSSPALQPMTESSKMQVDSLKSLENDGEPKAAEPGYYWKYQPYM